MTKFLLGQIYDNVANLSNNVSLLTTEVIQNRSKKNGAGRGWSTGVHTKPAQLAKQHGWVLHPASE